MKDKILLVLALMVFSLCPAAEVVTADTIGETAGASTGWNTLFAGAGSPSLTGTDWIFGPVTPSPTPSNGTYWFPGGEKFPRPPLPQRPEMNYSAFYSLIKRDGSGFILPSPYPTPTVTPLQTPPTPRPFPTWTIPVPGSIPTTAPTVSPSPAETSVPSGDVVLTDLSLAQEYVRIRNNGHERIDLTGWRLCDRAGRCITFIEWENGFRFELLPFSTLTIYSNQTGSPSSTRLYWPDEMWNDRGDTARLYNADGILVSSITR
ncbi:hypothetical protein J2741_001816 [Methanolinea mesophila]|uniref:lamin tail domain-containing protein n=1 Tax=Methanolinea mesophila TaxID=547055 RepID=UPI001AE951FF|nr:lamin tail domain-containing protein [Methanolinea mesophila]MBP1929269.1 hypothetical protein [Methanolinea mesophila]